MRLALVVSIISPKRFRRATRVSARVAFHFDVPGKPLHDRLTDKPLTHAIETKIQWNNFQLK